MSNLNDILAQAHEELAKELLRRIKSGEASATDLNVARQFLKDNRDVRQEVENRLRQGLGLPVLEEAAVAAAARAEKPEKGAVLPMPEKKKA
jgi:hypothetical protein